MLKTIRDMLIGACVAAAFGAAVAAVGTPPTNGPQLVDGTWLNGLAGGQNYTYQSGITAHAGGTQAACLSLTPGISMYQVSTVASGNDSVCLPFAVAGTTLVLANAAASNTLAIYAQPNNNQLTGVGDTINAASNSSAYSLSAANNVDCFSPKNGIWNCVKGS